MGLLWTLLALAVLVPVGLTLAGALTSPPHAPVPTGRILYLDADAPSEKTTFLRGLYVTQPGRPPRLLVHEDEPQDTDAGVREWFNYPTASPDGRWVAFEKQRITLLDEKQDVDNQLWVMPIDGPNPQPRMLLDLTARHLKQIVGLAWLDDNDLVFLEDQSWYVVPLDPKRKTDALSLPGFESIQPTSRDQSATRFPSLLGDNVVYVNDSAPGGALVIPGIAALPGISVYALSPDGRQVAFLPPGSAHTLRVAPLADPRAGRDLRARWGWSVFGRRHVTSLRWAPDGKYLAYTVSKPPGDDELFFINLETGKADQLPLRTGRAAWDWTR